MDVGLDSTRQQQQQKQEQKRRGGGTVARASCALLLACALVTCILLAYCSARVARRDARERALETAVVPRTAFESGRRVCTLRAWQAQPKDEAELIVQASVVDGSDAWTPAPIGMSASYALLPRGEREALLHTRPAEARPVADRPAAARPILLLAAFHTYTDVVRRLMRKGAPSRARIAATLRAQGHANTPLAKREYFRALKASAFVASPEGNGVDCHRHYEALMAGAVPVLEWSAAAAAKYAGCPILWTTDFSGLDPQTLREAYARMLDTEYDFSALLLSSYAPREQDEIKARGDYWTRRLCGGVEWYGHGHRQEQEQGQGQEKGVH